MDATPRGRHLAAIPEPECWDLLAGRPWGRLAVIVQDHPEVFPVDHRVVGRSLLVRTERGAKFRAACDARVAFQLDDVDADDRLGWTVLAVGYADEVVDVSEVGLSPAEDERLWTGERVHWLRIVPFKVTGRRLLPD